MRLKVMGSIAAIVAVAGSLLLASPAYADDYPSWDEVQAAKASVAATQAEVTKIQGLVQQLQDQANQAAADELKKAFAYTTAKNNLDEATAREATLDAQAKAASDEAAEAGKRFGQFVSQLYISGGNSVTLQLVLNKQNSKDLLSKLGAMSQLTGQSSELQKIAAQKKNLADALSKQAAAAKTVRQSLEADAQQKLQAAQAAQQAVNAQLAQQQQTNTTLLSKLASLQNTELQVEQQYAQGQAVAAAKAAAAAAAAAGGGDQTSYIDTSGVTVDPAAAQAYAYSQLGNYGWGSDQFSCLVKLWTQESGWRANAYNEDSGAYGIPQAWPADKLANAGADWRTNANTQINWGLAYISGAYGSPCAAWDHEMSVDPHWY